MSKLLRGNSVFIDTTEFSNARFDLQNPVFTEFCELCKKGKFQLLTTDITKSEIEKGVQQQTKEFCRLIKESNDFSSFLDSADRAILNELNERIKQNVLSAKASANLEFFFKNCNTEVLSIPDTAATDVILSFLNDNPPFDTSKKKFEFPDAFVIHTLKELGKQSRSAFYIISNDDDFKRACEGANNLIHLHSLAQLLNLVQADRATTKQIQKTLDNNLKDIEVQLNDLCKGIKITAEFPGITVIQSSVGLQDLLDTLIISCESCHAAVDFVCQVETNAILEVIRAPDFVVDIDSHTDVDVINITLEFDFDLKDPSFFQVTSTWAPTHLAI